MLSHFAAEKEEIPPLVSTLVEGGIHRFVNEWSLSGGPAGFQPTRLVVDARGTVYVVGAGAARVERFDRAGNVLGSWAFASEPLACLETGTLDGPAVALDSHDNLYVVYNLQEPGGAPRAFWSKFSPEGRLVWKRPLEGVFARHLAINHEDQAFIESISQLQQFNADGERLARSNVPALLVSSLRFWKEDFAALVEPLRLVEGSWQAPRLVVYKGMERQVAVTAIGRDPLSPEDRGSGLLRRPTDFVVDQASSRAFVVNAGQSRIEVFRKDRFLTLWGGEGEGPGMFRFAGVATVIEDITTGRTVARRVVAGGIARDREGYVYVADTFNNRIQKFQP